MAVRPIAITIGVAAAASVVAIFVSSSGTGADPRGDLPPAAVALDAPNDRLAGELGSRVAELRECRVAADGAQDSSSCDAIQADVERLLAELNARSERILASEPQVSEELLVALDRWRACMERAGHADLPDPAAARQRAALLDDPWSGATGAAATPSGVTTTVLDLAQREEALARAQTGGRPTTTLVAVPPPPEAPGRSASRPGLPATSTTFPPGAGPEQRTEGPGYELRRQSDRCEVDAGLDDAMVSQYEALIAADEGGA